MFARLARWLRFILAGAPKFWAVSGMTAPGALFNFRSNSHRVYRELQPAN